MARPSKPRARRPTYTWAERQRRKATVEEWINTVGYWCPGWGVPAHQAVDLTADHAVAVARGGPENGPLQVLCNRCNSRKRDRPESYGRTRLAIEALRRDYAEQQVPLPHALRSVVGSGTGVRAQTVRDGRSRAERTASRAW